MRQRTRPSSLARADAETGRDFGAAYTNLESLQNCGKEAQVLLKANVRGDKFFIDQKIIEVSKK